MEQGLRIESFADFLRALRLREKKSMGEVSRALDISVVYYSEVESGRKPPFPEGKVDYAVLAKVLKAQENDLKERAELDREKRRILKSFDCDDDSADLAVSFGRLLSNNELTDKQKEKIRKILNEEK